MMNLFGVFLLVAGSSSCRDAEFNSWCTTVGIEAPAVEVITTARSVAGRGVFATDAIQSGDIVMSIPPFCVLTQQTGAECFPEIKDALQNRHRHVLRALAKKEKNSFRHRLVRLFRRRRSEEKSPERNNHPEWQPELTAFALAALETDHPWALWVSQWMRDDPVLSLFEKIGAIDKSESQIEDAVTSTVNELQMMHPELSASKLQAALLLRVFQFESHYDQYLSDLWGESAPLLDKLKIVRMYCVLCSRAMRIAEDVVGVLPMFDMINHSLEPNLALTFDGKFKLFALRDIRDGEELFVCYTSTPGREDPSSYDKDKALWDLIQWGIPTTRDDWERSRIKNQATDNAKVLQEVK